MKGGGRTCEDVYIGGCRGWTETAKCLDFSIITISYLYLYVSWGHCAAGRNVVDSIPDGVTRIFHRRNPSGRTMALGLTQPLTKMSTRDISWGVKSAGA